MCFNAHFLDANIPLSAGGFEVLILRLFAALKYTVNNSGQVNNLEKNKLLLLNN
jgi:hypothetical protein